MGASWKTKLVGYLLIGGDIVKLIAQGVEEQGIPTGTTGWINFGLFMATGVGLIMTKDFDVSNSPNPVKAIVVPPALESKPNPAAAVQ